MFRKSLLLTALLSLIVGISAAQDDDMMSGTEFTVRIENVSGDDRGVFNTPVGAEEPAPAFPGESYEFTFEAQPGDALSFATMYVQSNDLIFAPGEEGIALFDEDGNPVTGDVTDQILLIDAGTEVNEEPGVGENQAPRQAGPDTGEEEMGVVSLIEDVMDGFEHPNPTDVLIVTLTADEMMDEGPVTFTATLENISETSPISPGVFIVHTEAAPLFTLGAVDRGNGLEAIAEDGNPAQLGAYLGAVKTTSFDFPQPVSPGLYVVHSEAAPLFTLGEADRGEGLEAIAEDGNPAPLLESLSDDMVTAVGVINTPVGADSPAPIGPGAAYEFTFTAAEGDALSFAVMYIQSNDLIFAPGEEGIALFDEDGSPISGNVTDRVFLIDAGTEVNEEPGVGENQAPRQAGPDTGEEEMGVVSLIEDVMDEFAYPAPSDVIRVIITPSS